MFVTIIKVNTFGKYKNEIKMKHKMDMLNGNMIWNLYFREFHLLTSFFVSILHPSFEYVISMSVEYYVSFSCWLFFLIQKNQDKHKYLKSLCKVSHSNITFYAAVHEWKKLNEKNIFYFMEMSSCNFVEPCRIMIYHYENILEIFFKF
jgi:hypothetical protein